MPLSKSTVKKPSVRRPFTDIAKEYIVKRYTVKFRFDIRKISRMRGELVWVEWLPIVQVGDVFFALLRSARSRPTAAFGLG
jgi:hypothetical protein